MARGSPIFPSFLFPKVTQETLTKIDQNRSKSALKFVGTCGNQGTGMIPRASLSVYSHCFSDPQR